LVVKKGKEEIDFTAWLARPWLHRPFRDCICSAAYSLALGREELRMRVFNALCCLARCKERDVPGVLRPQFEVIRDEVFRRAGLKGPNATMGHAYFGRLRRSFLRCNPRTAERLARMIFEMDRYLLNHPSDIKKTD
jgi:hypothetical protein